MRKAALKSSSAQVRPVRVSSSDRRRPTSENARIRVTHSILPCYTEKAAEAVVGERISDFLVRNEWSRQEKVDGRLRWTWRIPTICILNGKPLLQRQWKRRRIAVNDNIEFVSKPLGGGGRGKAIAGIVGMIALAAFAPMFSGALLSAGVPALFANTATALMAIGGGLMLCALRPKPRHIE